ncbi:AdoMet dependent proline di-methyltransferase-domain-containing protein [Aspergillus undulatus]|uniref:AdoMet dependent proline di-methyltransferase-domain-containing protein n=1 Tax=Aspergillus undulatus TaxID=1810928 RepID=UPI003CCDF13B
MGNSNSNITPNSNPPLNSEVEQNPDSKVNHGASLNSWNSFDTKTKTTLGLLGDYPVRRMDPRCVSPTSGKLKLGVDCGAGVGRVTEGVLRDACERVDAVEPVSKFADVIKGRKEKEEVSRQPAVMGDIYEIGLESWVPEPSKKYDLVWRQFCANYVTDVQLEDSGVTRTDGKFRALAGEAGFRVLASEVQLGFPKEFNLLPVRFYAF